LAQISGGATRPATAALPEPKPSADSDNRPAEKLRLATCQFPVRDKIAENAKYIREFLHQAAKAAPVWTPGATPAWL
jgi:hypothetical protein